MGSVCRKWLSSPVCPPGWPARSARGAVMACGCTRALGSAYPYSLSSVKTGHPGVKILGREGMLKSQKVAAMF